MQDGEEESSHEGLQYLEKGRVDSFGEKTVARTRSEGSDYIDGHQDVSLRKNERNCAFIRLPIPQEMEASGKKGPTSSPKNSTAFPSSNRAIAITELTGTLVAPTKTCLPTTTFCVGATMKTSEHWVGVSFSEKGGREGGKEQKEVSNENEPVQW